MRFRYIGTEEMIYQGPPARVLGYGDIVRALTNPNPPILRTTRSEPGTGRTRTVGTRARA